MTAPVNPLSLLPAEQLPLDLASLLAAEVDETLPELALLLLLLRPVWDPSGRLRRGLDGDLDLCCLDDDAIAIVARGPNCRHFFGFRTKKRSCCG